MAGSAETSERPLPARFIDEVRKVLHKLDEPQGVRRVRYFPQNGYEVRVVGCVPADVFGQKPLVGLSALYQKGRVFRILPVGAAASLRSAAGTPDEDAREARKPDPAACGYRVIEVVDAASLTPVVQAPTSEAVTGPSGPLGLAALCQQGRVFRILPIGAVADVRSDADRAEEDAGERDASDPMICGYKVTEVVDATGMMDPVKLGLPEGTTVVRVRLMPADSPRADQSPEASTAVIAAAEHSEQGSAGRLAHTSRTGEPDARGSDGRKLAAGGLRGLPSRAAVTARVQAVTALQPEPAPPEPSNATAESPATVEGPLDSRPADQPALSYAWNQTERMLVAQGFEPLDKLHVDVSIKRDPNIERQVPESTAKLVFAEQDEIVDIPWMGGVGLDECLFLGPARFCHQPLYFEEVNPERFGSSRCRLLQPVFSGYRFFFTVPALPYMMAVHRPRGCYYDTSPYLPGRPAPWHDESLPLSLRGATAEGLAITALIFALPP